MSNQIEWRAKAAGGVGDVCSAFSAAGILLSQPRFSGAAGGVGAVPLAAALKNQKCFVPCYRLQLVAGHNPGFPPQL